MTQTTIWEKISPKARRTDPITSKKAGEKSAKFSNGHYRLIMEALKKGNLTGKEIANMAGLTNVQVMRRIHELRKFGVVDGVLDSGVLKSRGGCLVWRRKI